MKQKDMPHFRDEVFAPRTKEEVQQEEEQFAREAPKHAAIKHRIEAMMKNGSPPPTAPEDADSN